jgi:DNA repair protein RecO (recombination protein O)
MAIDGLVLREMNSGENDKRLLVLTAEKGKIWICAKGGRSIKSNKSAICRAFTYAEFEIYEKNNMFYLSGGSPNKAFFAYKTDLDGYALACYVTAICEEITGEEAEAGEALRATLNTFYAIENQLYPIEQMKAAYELFAASVSGFAPDLSTCQKCGKTVRYMQDKSLQAVNGEWPFRYTTDWYDYQSRFINGLDVLQYTDQPLYTDVASISEVKLYDRKYRIDGAATIQLYGDRVMIETPTQTYVFPFEEVSTVSVLGKNKVNIYHEGKIYQLKGDKRFNGVKYVQTFHRAKHILKGEDSEFLGL